MSIEMSWRLQVDTRQVLAERLIEALAECEWARRVGEPRALQDEYDRRVNTLWFGFAAFDTDIVHRPIGEGRSPAASPPPDRGETRADD